MKKTLSFSLVGLALCFASVAQLGGCDDDETTTVTSATKASSSTGTGAQGGGGQGPGGQGGVQLTGEDLCPGDAFTVNLTDVLTLHGDTSMAMDDYQSLCNSSGADLVYAFTLVGDGSLFITYTSATAGFDPTMYLRTTCDDDNSVVWCSEFSPTRRAHKGHMTAGTYYLIVDGAAMSAGEYNLVIDYRAPSCGDGVGNPGEQCDDGNLAPNDGCDGSCMYEPGAFESCAGPEALTINAGHTVLSGSTIANVNDHTYNEADCTIGGVPPGPQDTGGPDRVYALTAGVTGTMTMTLGFDLAGTAAICEVAPSDPGCWDRVLHVRHVDMAQGPGICQDMDDITDANPANWIPPSAMTQIACDGFGTPPGYTQSVTFPVTINEVYYVFIDGFYSGAFTNGPYNLHIDLN